MGQAVLFLGWKTPNPGMDEKAMGFLSTEGMAFLKKHEGKYFERMDVLALTPHGGGLTSGMILHGDRAKLDEFRRTDEFESFSLQLARLFSGYGVVPGLNFDGIQAVMKRMGTK
jgi:hypothetical protein